MSSVYSEIILDHYRNPRNYGTLTKPTQTFALYNPLCGDRMRMDIAIKNDTIQKIAFSGSGCAISQAAASLLTERVKGKKISHLRKMPSSVMLKLLGITLNPVRLKCALLPFEALKNIINSF